MVLWFTGMSGAGKTTLANQIELRIRRHGHRVAVLDGDVMRTKISKELGFSKQHRDENVRRLGELCEMLTRGGVIAIVAAISPYRESRDAIRSKVEDFIEVHVDCPLDVLVGRDPKGLYKRALAGELEHFTGISDPYEPPLNAEIIVDTSIETEEQSVEKIWSVVQHFLGDTPVHEEERIL